MMDAKGRDGRGGSPGTVARVAGVLLVGTAILVAGAWWVVFARPTTGVDAGQPIKLEVPGGSSTAAIGKLLADAGVVANPNRFRLEARLRGSDGKLRAGVYDFVTGMAYAEVLERLEAGPPVRYADVTIPEGFTVEQIATRIAVVTGIPEQQLRSLGENGAAGFGRPYLSWAYEGSLEGYLFPKTYRIKAGSSAEDVLGTMLDQFEKETANLDMTLPRVRGLDLHDVVTIASMIEREAKVGSERPLVSSVIHNRLARGMRLEIDATVEYVLPGQRFRLLNRDLLVESPFNTYRHAGLPPGPIANPGLAALEAATRPADTDYVYYVLTGKDGSHTFARTEAEFLAAKRLSKEVFGR